MNLPHIQTQQRQLGMASLQALSRPIVRNRKTSPVELNTYTDYGELAPRPDPTQSWRTLQASRKNLLNFPYSRMAKMALDLAPQLDKGRFDFLRMGNPGFVVEQEGNDRAVDGAKEFLQLLTKHYGSVSNHFDKMFTGIFIFGGLFKELVLNEQATEPVDLVINNPMLIDFRRETVPGRGLSWVRGQYQNGQFYSFQDDPLVKYIGFDSDVDNPYGRPMISPSVYASLTLLQLIDILQRVLANQGLSRIDYTLEIEQLLTLIDRNPDLAGNDEATAQFINQQIDAIQAVLDNLDVDQDYVHTSAVSVNYASNPVGSTSHLGLEVIVQTLQRDVTNGMKSVATLSNVLDSTTETHGTIQLEYYVSSVQSVQEEVGNSIKEDLDNANIVRGIQSDLTFYFKKQRTADKRQLAETRKIEIDTIISQLDAGIINENEARDRVKALDSVLEMII